MTHEKRRIILFSRNYLLLLRIICWFGVYCDRADGQLAKKKGSFFRSCVLVGFHVHSCVVSCVISCVHSCRYVFADFSALLEALSAAYTKYISEQICVIHGSCCYMPCECYVVLGCY